MWTFLKLSILTGLLSVSWAISGDDDDKRRRFPCCRSSTSSSSSSCSSEVPPVPAEPCCGRVVVDKYDFDITVPIIGTTWSIYQGKDDGVFTTGPCHGGLTSYPFDIWALSVDRTQDHYKYMAYDNTGANIPEGGNLTVEWVASGRTFRIDQTPIPEAYLDDNDYRLSNAILSTFDYINNVTYEFLITNDRVYALYTLIGSFAVCTPLKIRKPCDWHKLRIVFYGAVNQIGFQVDGVECFLILNPGFIGNRKYLVNDMGSVQVPAVPTFIQYGFGTATFLDYYPVCQRKPGCNQCSYPLIREALVNTGTNESLPQWNPLLGTGYPARYWDPLGIIEQNHIWGQGAQLNLTSLKVWQDFCYQPL